MFGAFRRVDCANAGLAVLERIDEGEEKTLHSDCTTCSIFFTVSHINTKPHDQIVHSSIFGTTIGVENSSLCKFHGFYSAYLDGFKKALNAIPWRLGITTIVHSMTRLGSVGICCTDFDLV